MEWVTADRSVPRETGLEAIAGSCEAKEGPVGGVQHGGKKESEMSRRRG